MRKYGYFPGCSAESTGLGYGLSVEAVAAPLDMELAELEDWNCCGSTPYGSLAEEESFVVAARNLALAEKTGLDLVTPCSACYVTLAKANLHMIERPALLARVNRALAAAGLEYHGHVRVRHLVDVLFSDLTPEFIASRMKTGLNGLKVASYYGCQLVRPRYGFDDAEAPRSLDALVTALGGEAVNFPLKARCCGGSLTLSEESRVLGLMRRILRSAADNGAQCLVTACPLCQTNLDAYQAKVNAAFGTDYRLPVLFITQLIGLTLGIEDRRLGMDTNIVAPSLALERVYNPVNYQTTRVAGEGG